MLETGCDGCNDLTFDCALEDSWVNPSIGANQLTYKLVQVEGDAPFIPATEDELIEVEHLLAEPQTEKILDDDIMYLDSEGTEKSLAIEDFPYTVDYYNRQEAEYGIPDVDAAQAGKQDSKYEFVDSMLQGVGEEENLHSPFNLSSVCSDYLLDTGFVERSPQLDCGLRTGSSIRNLGSECHTQSIERDIDFGEMSELSKAIIRLPESTSDQNALYLDNMNIHELQDAFRSMFGRDTSVRDKQWLMRRILFGLQNFSEIGNVSSLVDIGLSSIENEVSMILIPENDLSERMYTSCTNILDSRTSIVGQGVAEDGCGVKDALTAISEDDRVGFGLLGEQESALITSKRLRKPTRRYIEETSEMESRCCNERVKTPPISSGDKFLHVRTKSQYRHKGSSAMLVGSGIRVPCGLHARRGRLGKDTTLTGGDSNDSKEHIQCTVVPKRSCASRPSESDSQDDMSDDGAISTTNEKSGIRRQHHRQWMVLEVMKLIEGVSQYGVGRWTEIKRHLFSASAHRTAVDLKDKWRNLLRASGAQPHGRNKVKPQKHMTVPIPQTALRRVRELAIIHPYPRERKSKLPSAATSPPTATISNGTFISHRVRTVHNRSLA